MVRELDAEIGVERRFPFGFGGLETVAHVAEGLDHGVDLRLGEDFPGGAGGGGELLTGGGLLGLGLVDPGGDESRVGPGIDRGPVLGRRPCSAFR
ncbi:hypothetical protein QC334_25105 [Streptomyces sp. DH18]|uniref:hypothetical protein n=1 Tax=Streptomyces sp. DH18 TaxID=3040126 RepID=UPI002441DF2E|nr:hypothetical protein [Streptomyces sp. DH18]MDG9685968.1 hypothetical protein [Streptomyces sp. DH18]